MVIAFDREKFMKGATAMPVVLHSLVWIIVYIAPMFLTASTASILDFDVSLLKKIASGYALTYSSLLISFYINWFVLFDKFLIRKRVVVFVVLNVLIALFLAWCIHYATVYLTFPKNMDFEPVREVLMATPIKLGMIAMSAISMLFVDMVCIAIKSLIKVYDDEKKRQRIALEQEKEKTAAELKTLKDKLNPHFLFNALNNIYSLAAIDSDKTQSAIDSLSKLLRYVLYENDDMVPLSGEIKFTNSYIELMALRLDPARTALNVNIDIDSEDNLKVAPLMMMTLIENAFKHGVSSHEQSSIDIDIHSVDAESGNRIRCEVSNGLFPKDARDKSGSGIGIENLRNRLEIIYPGQYLYDVKTDGSRYSVTLEIPLKKALCHD